MRKVYSNACPPPAVRQDFGTVDLCEPDTTMSVAQIIDAYRNGLMIEGDADATYDGDDDLDDDDSMVRVYDDVLDAIDHSYEEQPKEEQPKEEQPKEEQPKEEQPKEEQSKED